MPDDRRRDGSKPSFSELDKRRKERRNRRDDGAPRPSKRASERAQKTYRAALEKAFDEGRVEEFAATISRPPERRLPRTDRPDSAPPPKSSDGRDPDPPAPPPAPPETREEKKKRAAASKEHAKRRELLGKIREASSPEEVTEAVDRYLAKHDALPRDFEILEKSLRHRSTEVVMSALRALEALLSSGKPRRSRSLSMRLTLLEETHDDDDVRDLAAALRKAL